MDIGLARLGIKPSKRLGQSFLIDEGEAARLVDRANVTKDDVVLDIGAGLGLLTELLAHRAGKVIAVEKDRRLAAILKRKFSSAKNVEVIEGDVLHLTFPSVTKIVSTPPYSISSRLTLKMAEIPFREAYIILQLEFALKLIARHGSRRYGRITVLTQHWADVEILNHVPRKAFYPKPKVESVLVGIRRREPSLKAIDEEAFREFVTALFTRRNRTLRAALKDYASRSYLGEAKKLVAQISPPDIRVFQLDVDGYEQLYRVFRDALSTQPLWRELGPSAG